MKKAVIATGGKQYLVSEGETIEAELLETKDGKLSFDVLLLVDGEKTQVGSPKLDGSKVQAEVVETIKADKVTSIRFKAKKRVHKTRGHRQNLNQLKITKIS